LIVNIRKMRADLEIDRKIKTPVKIHAASDVQELVEKNRSMVERLAFVEGIEFTDQSLAHTAGARTTSKFEVVLVYEKKVDVAAEGERLTKELERLKAQLARTESQLSNEQFLSKAPSHVVEGLRKQQADLKLLIEKIKKQLDNLG